MATVDQLANGDFTKHEFFWEMDVITFFNYISLMIDKGQYNEEQMKKSMKQNAR